MRAADVEYFKILLINQRSEILNKANVFREHTHSEKMFGGDEGDLASQELTLNLDLRLQERQVQLLQKVDHALAKIDNGSFGLCEICEEPLSVNRLKARPVANLCISCKEDQESKERVFA